MEAFVYKTETIENYDDDAATEAALNAEGADGWDVISITHKPNASTGKTTATVLYRGSSSSSSVSSSSSSSSTSSSSSSSSTSSSSSSSSTSSSSSSSNSSSSSSISVASSSSSSSSVSDAPWMGAGWPYLPDEIEVVIGNRWNESNIYFVENDVIRLKRAGEDTSEISYTEDGTLVANNTTNRLKMRIGDKNPTSIWWYLTPAKEDGTGASWYESAIYAGVPINPYDFKAFWDTDPYFSEHVIPSYFDVTTTSGFTPYLYYQDEIFKSITFIDN